MLAAYAGWFAAGTIFLCVVDPGVGGARPAVILEADGRWYVGPGNDLFELVQRRAGEARSWDTIGSQSAYRPAFTGATSLHPSQACWRAANPAGPTTPRSRGSLPLGIERVEFEVEIMLARFAGIDRAALEFWNGRPHGLRPAPKGRRCNSKFVPRTLCRECLPWLNPTS
jgi:hypothetical protein